MSKEHNNKSIASQALLEMNTISEAIKEESKKSLNALLADVVCNVLRESSEKEDKGEEEDKKDYEVTDDIKTDTTEEKSGEESDTVASAEDGTSEAGDANADGKGGEIPEPDAAVIEPEKGEGDNEGDDFSDLSSDDDSLDLTGEKDFGKILKVYKRLNDNDQICIKQADDKIELKDNDTNAEYIIDLGGESESEEDDSEEPEIGLNESDIAGIDDDELTGLDSDEFDSDSDTDVTSGTGEMSSNELRDAIANLQKRLDSIQKDVSQSISMAASAPVNETKKKTSKKAMKENKSNILEIDLGYTDDYQKKDPIAGLKSSDDSSLDAGVPKGTQKPWAGKAKDKGQPFDNAIKESDETPVITGDDSDVAVDEATNVGGFVQQNSTTMSHIPNSSGRKARNAHKEGAQVNGTPDNRTAMAESIKALKKENKELKEAILAIKKSLSEAYVTNANLGKITRLFLENVTSKAEKVDIINRFTNEAKTIEQSKTLYESIKRELEKAGNNKPLNITESKTAKGTTEVNSKIEKPSSLLKSIDLMNRMLNY